MEVARVLRKKVYVTAAKMRILECLGMPKEDMQWLTLDERESHIHVVPMWTLASFKRLKHVSNMYMVSALNFNCCSWKRFRGSHRKFTSKLVISF